MVTARFVVVASPNVFSPVQVLLFARRVEEAAVMVMSPVPSKLTPFMFLPVSSAVAVPAFPDMSPVMMFEKVLLPENVLLSARSVVEAVSSVSHPNIPPE